MFRSIIFLTMFLLTAGNLSAKKGESLFDRWSHTDHKSIDIYINMDILLANRMTTNEMRGMVVDSGLQLGVDITVRGRYRRRTCDMPPILLQFDKDLLRQAGLNTHNDYKIVTPCTEGEEGQDAIVREALAYDLYRILDPEASFRTQLLTITYHNTADGTSKSSYGIMIEDTDELKDRLDSDNCEECYNQPLSTYTNAESVALFQYMIGNPDYSTMLGRNLKLMQDDAGRITAVPYDFDFSGLVNASYGRTTHPDQKSMTDRVFVWEFETLPNMLVASDTFAFLEVEFLETVDTYDHLSDKSKREITRYLKGFFRDLKHDRIGS